MSYGWESYNTHSYEEDDDDGDDCHHFKVAYEQKNIFGVDDVQEEVIANVWIFYLNFFHCSKVFPIFVF